MRCWLGTHCSLTISHSALLFPRLTFHPIVAAATTKMMAETVKIKVVLRFMTGLRQAHQALSSREKRGMISQ
nr:hypothetical protein KXZ65_20835 [Pectobacterium sp. PL152]